MVVCAHQFADVGLGERWTVDICWPLLCPGWRFGTWVSFRVSPQGDAGRGVGEGLEGQWTLLGAEVCVGQGGIQREKVGRWGQDLGPLSI